VGKDYLDLFGRLASGAEVKNLWLVDVNITGSGSYVGGLVGENSYSGTVTTSFWDIETSGQTTSAGGTGKTTAEMQDIRTYQDAGWDFVGEIVNGTHDFWLMPEAGGYPVLSIFHGYTPPQLEGLGTRDEPYLISDAMELGAMIHYSHSAHYRLASSIDLSGIHWGMAVIPSFSGTFDGNNLTISHLTLTGASYVGLFGQLGSGAEVKDLGLVDVNISGSGNYVGGLVRKNYGAVTECYSTGAVSGTGWSVGGLVGANQGNVTQCYSTGTVSDNGTAWWSYVGGLVGENTERGFISDCYSTGAVSGGSSVGGLVGNNWGTVTQCYSTGAVSGSANYVGGLVGNNGKRDWYSEAGTVTRCYSTGTVSGTDYVGGLVGQNYDGAVTGCYSTGVVTGNSRVGGLVGYHWGGTVTQCYSTGAVSGSSNVGGLVGYNWSTVSNCYSTGAVSGKSVVGGLVGENDESGFISDCYSTGAVSASEAVGGLVGSNGGTVSCCYSTGPVTGSGEYIGGLVGCPWVWGGAGWPGHEIRGNVSNCFWDIQTSGRTTSNGGTGKTTAEMQTAKTFLEAGWDFIDETANGTEDIWWILEGRDYPRLWWELVD